VDKYQMYSVIKLWVCLRYQYLKF